MRRNVLHPLPVTGQIRSTAGACFFLILLVFGAKLQAQELSPEKRDLAVDAVADILFESRAGSLRRQIDVFEDAHNVKLHFTVSDSSIDQLGGLSEHLFRIYKTLVLPAGSRSKSIFGEFGVNARQQASQPLTYKTSATPDLRDCALPLNETDRFDSARNAYFEAWELGAEASELYIDQTLADANHAYDQVLRRNAHCGGLSMADYDLFCNTTAAKRAAGWSNDCKQISDVLLAENSLLGNTGVPIQIGNYTASGVHVADIAHAVSACARREMDYSAILLEKETGVRFFFATRRLDYFIPRDSLQVFVETATAAFTDTTTGKYILAVFLRLSDPETHKHSSVLLVRQLNGQWLSDADVSYANYNSHGDYNRSTYAKYYDLFKNIPKPLYICYQVAKVNGVFTTVYLRRAAMMKGLPAIYGHVFKYDAGFDPIKLYDDKISSLQNMVVGGLANPAVAASLPALKEQLSDLRLKKKLAYIGAMYQPQFKTSSRRIKEQYLTDSNYVKAASLRELDQLYGDLFPGNQIDAITQQQELPSDIYTGTCFTHETDDVIGQALDLTSLLLAPTGLDFVPDMLSVCYYAATGDWAKSGFAAASIALPGTVNGVVTLAKNSAGVLKSVNRGSYILRQGNDLLEVTPDPDLFTKVIGLDQVHPTLATKMANNGAAVAKLIGKKQESYLNLDARLQSLYKNIDELPPAKRHDFAEKCLDDEQFLNKVLDDPDEVLRFGGLLTRGVAKQDFIASIPQFITNPSLGEEAWEYFQKEEWGKLEHLVNSNNINDGWPPNYGFIEVELTRLDVNFEFDRYGGQIVGDKFMDAGRFVAERGANFSGRALPANYLNEKPYKKYRVVREIKSVKRGPAIPWFGQTGNGLQFELPFSISRLLSEGFIVEI